MPSAYNTFHAPEDGGSPEEAPESPAEPKAMLYFNCDAAAFRSLGRTTPC